MSSQRQSTLAFKCTGWFTLLLLVAYVVYVPIHLATEAHCLPGTPHVHNCDQPAQHDHGHDHHHSADEHDLNATSKQDTQLSLVFLAANAGLIVPAPAGATLSAANPADILLDRSPVRSLPSRAPPLA
ncbi:MAG: hypothetical protein ACPGVU_06225 [Limisphaerales bacterium]